MKSKSANYTPIETALAQRLFTQARANGTLKPPRAVLSVVMASTGQTQSLSQRATYRDYLKDARALLAKSLPGRR
jgi:hypothetical protein